LSVEPGTSNIEHPTSNVALGRIGAMGETIAAKERRELKESSSAPLLAATVQLKMGSAVVSTAPVGVPPTSWQHSP